MKQYAKNSDWVLRLDTRPEGEAEPCWMPVMTGFQTLGEARGDTTSEFYYLDGFGSPETSVDGTARSFAATGHRVYGDPLQEWLFAYERQWNTAKRYTAAQYFNTVTGQGEQGSVSISFASTQTGSPKERAAFGVNIVFQGVPAQYTHSLGPYRVSYHLGEGDGSVEDDAGYSIGEGAIVQSAEGVTAPAGRQFAQWNTRADGGGAGYRPGDVIILLDDADLYAVYG